MRRNDMLDAIRSMRTDDPSESVTTAAAAAADDTSVAAAAAAAATAAATAATNAAATTIARLEHELGVMAAAAAAAAAATAATTTAAANAAAEEIARLQHELGEMTHRLRTASTPQVFYPAPDPREVDKWVARCDSIPWGTNSPAPTPTQQIRRAGTQDGREHQFSQSASSSAQLVEL